MHCAIQVTIFVRSATVHNLASTEIDYSVALPHCLSGSLPDISELQSIFFAIPHNYEQVT